ncbi:enoyl-CoA hydratase-related protein [Pseudorhodoferax sp. Leaf274]|uniref:enoyl-CoA hydratase-related protein n=1 Tax=Pseudorhodoferax sp. Leaf274 TaxID=1736318 RepID=UPI000702A2AF|nr:enoyl-CoA hydratase-related protein [Pseudorhodoferax sp. Leaf274]KQP36237.1 enoyl-CoA hydratase [Pseudorhodoferax sp. Leaf274]
MEFTQLHYSVADRVAVLRFERPERMNAWTATLETELRQALALAEQDDGVRCIVLTGAGRAFCAGMDMEVLSASGDRSGGPLAEGRRYLFMDRIDKPLVAAINGAAAGVGLCLALYCDLRFVAAGAKLTAPYARRGLAAEHGIAWLLPRLVGPMHAADLLLSGRTLLADEAERMGLARMLPAEGFIDAVLQQARELANATSPRSVRTMKRQLREARTQTLPEATDAGDREIAACRGTEDFREGVQHFIEKRAPRFTGR